MRFASAPIARTFLVMRSIATTLGSSMTMPRPFTGEEAEERANRIEGQLPPLPSVEFL
jgi:hypothetical protein